MTYRQKHKENKKLMAGYVAYLDECGNYDDRLKLIGEIARLDAQSKEIEQMPFGEIETDINDYTLEVTAICFN